MCRQYHEIENKLNCVNCINDTLYLKERNVTAYSMDRRSKTISYRDKVLKKNTYIYPNPCRENDELFNKIRDSRLPNETSFSPWEYIINLDENRFDWNKFLTCVLFF